MSAFSLQNAAESDPSCRILGAFGSHVSDQGLLGPKVHRKQMGSFVERPIHIIVGGVLDDQVQLVRNAPNSQKRIRALPLQQRDHTTVSPRHIVFPVRADRNDLVTPR
jgi:hypothetical protein